MRNLRVTALVGLLAAACGSGPLAPVDSGSDTRPAHEAGRSPQKDAAPKRDAEDARPRADASPRDATNDAARDGRATDAGSGDATFVAAAHALPHIPNNGGPALVKPTVVTVTFANDPQRAYIEKLDSYLVGSPWLAAVGPEYGIGLGTNVNVELAEDGPASIDDPGIQRLVESLVAAGTVPGSDAGAVTPELPSEVDAGADAADAGPDGGSVVVPPFLYMMFFPTTTTVYYQPGVALCDATGGGYHFQTALSSHGHSFVYGVLSPCANLTPSDFVQATSHELIEAVTDPSASAPAYSIVDLSDPWAYFGGEVGDLCSLLTPQWSEGGYTGIQRVYSDKSAAAGGDPCLPEPEPYYANDVEPNTAMAVAAGQSVTFDVTGWSTAPVADWGLSAQLYLSNPMTFIPTFSVSTTTLNNGQKATLTVTVPADAPSQSYALGLVYAAATQTDYTSALVEIYVP